MSAPLTKADQLTHRKTAGNNKQTTTTFLSCCSVCNAAITRTPKATYPRTYKVRLVLPDGSTYSIRYEEPFKIIKQPIDPTYMTEEEKKERMNRLKPEKPKKIYELEEEEDENYNQRSWTNLIKTQTKGKS